MWSVGGQCASLSEGKLDSHDHLFGIRSQADATDRG
jgi:hypothetical protein